MPFKKLLAIFNKKKTKKEIHLKKLFILFASFYYFTILQFLALLYLLLL